MSLAMSFVETDRQTRRQKGTSTESRRNQVTEPEEADRQT